MPPSTSSPIEKMQQKSPKQKKGKKPKKSAKDGSPARKEELSDSGTPDITFNKKMTKSKLSLLGSAPLNDLLSVSDFQAAVAEVAETPKNPKKKKKHLVKKQSADEKKGKGNIAKVIDAARQSQTATDSTKDGSEVLVKQTAKVSTSAEKAPKAGKKNRTTGKQPAKGKGKKGKAMAVDNARQSQATIGSTNGGSEPPVVQQATAVVASAEKVPKPKKKESATGKQSAKGKKVKKSQATDGVNAPNDATISVTNNGDHAAGLPMKSVPEPKAKSDGTPPMDPSSLSDELGNRKGAVERISKTKKKKVAMNVSKSNSQPEAAQANAKEAPSTKELTIPEPPLEKDVAKKDSIKVTEKRLKARNAVVKENKKRPAVDSVESSGRGKRKKLATTEVVEGSDQGMTKTDEMDKAALVKELLKQAELAADNFEDKVEKEKDVRKKTLKKKKQKSTAQRPLLQSHIADAALQGDDDFTKPSNDKEEAPKELKGTEMPEEKKLKEIDNKKIDEKSKKNSVAQGASATNVKTRERGVIYLGHIPHGFYEEEMRSYFSQFGRVLRVRLSRSMKTGRSRGYAFIKFADKDVAAIAAEAMDGYLMHGSSMVSKMVPEEKVHSDMFRPTMKAMRSVRTSMLERRAFLSRAADPAKVAERSMRIQKNLKKKQHRLAQLNLNYKFPTIENATS